MKHRIIVLLVGLLVWTGLPHTGATAVQSWLDTTNRATVVAWYNTQYRAAGRPDIGWTGDGPSCQVGETSPAFRDAVVQRINFYRHMAGVGSVALRSDYNAKAEAAALMMSANRRLDHAPAETWQCYSADGATAAGKSNLSLGHFGWEAIDSQMRDAGNNNAAVGHRRWILYPQTQFMGTGDVAGGTAMLPAHALWVFDEHLWDVRPATRDEFVAWPPRGYVPWQVVWPRWSFAYPGADFSTAHVQMTYNGAAVPIQLEPVISNGTSEHALVWRPNNLGVWDPWPQPDADATYHIVIGNVLINGVARTFSYDVTIIDPEFTPAPPTFQSEQLFVPLLMR